MEDVLAKLNDLDSLLEKQMAQATEPKPAQPSFPQELAMDPPGLAGQGFPQLQADQPMGQPQAKRPRQDRGPEWQCDCGFKNSMRNEICGGKGNMGCKQPNPNPPPPSSQNWDSSSSQSWGGSGSQNWNDKGGKGDSKGGKGDSKGKGDGKGGKGDSSDWWTCDCGFRNELKNEICGGNGPMGCKQLNPRPAKWICQCGFKNDMKNDICGGHGPMGCKWPKPSSSSSGPPEDKSWNDKGSSWNDSGWNDKGNSKGDQKGKKGDQKGQDKGKGKGKPAEQAGVDPEMALLQQQLQEQLATQAREQNLSQEQQEQLGIFYQQQLEQHVKELQEERKKKEEEENANKPPPKSDDDKWKSTGWSTSGWLETGWQDWSTGEKKVKEEERPKYKVAMCRFNMNGQCGRGANCTYAHTEAEMNTENQAPSDTGQEQGGQVAPAAAPAAAPAEEELAQLLQAAQASVAQPEFSLENLDPETMQQLQLVLAAQQAAAATNTGGATETALAVATPGADASEEEVRQAWLMQVAGALLQQQEHSQALAASGIDPELIAQAGAFAWNDAVAGAAGGARADFNFWSQHQALLCKFHVMGTCRNGALCNFPHTNEDLIPKLLTKGFCKAFLISVCEKGDECKYKHGLSQVDIIPFQEMAERQWKEQLAQQQRESDAILRSGDWKCPGCGNLNFAKRDICNTKNCGLTRLSSITGNVVPTTADGRALAAGLGGTGAKADEEFWRAHSILLCKFHVQGSCRDGAMCNFPHTFEDLIPKLLTKRYCKSYLIAECSKGDKCRYKHGQSETTLQNVLQSRSMICKAWMKGLCSKGTECIYAHSEEELVAPTDVHKFKTKMCRHFEQGYCAKGSVCTFAHKEEEILPPPGKREPGMR